MKRHITWMSLILMSSIFLGGCILKKKNDDLVDVFNIKVLPAAPVDPYLDILVAYVDTDNFSGEQIPRLKLVKPSVYDSTTGFKFLGRAYSKDYPSRNGFGIPVHEYWTVIGSGMYTSDGFKYLFGMKCQPYNDDMICPTTENRLKIDPVFYSYPMENPAAGIIPLFEYDTPGGIGSGVGGVRGVSYTVNFQDIMGMQAVYGQIPYRIVGYIFHSTKEDREKRLR